MSAEEGFAERYRLMSETELMGLARKYDDLTEAAQSALRAEFARRGLEPPLIEEEEVPPANGGAGLVTVAEYQDLTEGIVARAVLEQEGIQCFLSDANTSSLSNVVSARLQVAPEDEAAAREVLSQSAPQQFATESGEEFVRPVCPKCGSMDVIANDHERKLLPGVQVSEAEWRCMDCGRIWADDEELEEPDGALR